MTIVLGVWFATSVAGSILAVLALREVAANWLALKRVKTPNADILAEILVGNMYQQTARLVMEGLCWTAGLIVYAAPAPPRRNPVSTAVVSWMLIAFRALLVVNNGVEYLSNRHRRQQLYRRRVMS
jgi:hypothetical protein